MSATSQVPLLSYTLEWTATVHNYTHLAAFIYGVAIANLPDHTSYHFRTLFTTNFQLYWVTSEIVSDCVALCDKLNNCCREIGNVRGGHFVWCDGVLNGQLCISLEKLNCSDVMKSVLDSFEID